MQKIIVIVSGGMDSTTLLYDLLNQKDEYEVVGALTFNYGQRHANEINYAEDTCKKLGVDWKLVNLESVTPLLGGSALTDDIQVPEGHYEEENMKLTVVPNRNMIMLSIAIGYAISKKADLVAYGAHAGDHTIYPDCRPEFIKALSELAKISDFHPVSLLTPYQDITKVEILKIGLGLNLPYEETWTCYKGGLMACGKCGSCQERLAAFKANGIEDPAQYETRELIAKV